MKVSDFLSNDMPPFLLGAFYGKTVFAEGGRSIYTYSTYRNWTKVYDNPALCNSSKATYLNSLNAMCAPYSYWMRGVRRFSGTDIVFVLENDLKLSQDDFFDRLYKKIDGSAFANDINFTESKKMFIRGFFELRGSLDRVYKFLTMDYVYDSDKQALRGKLLVDKFNVPASTLNYNFRENQPQYIAGIKRATQFRIALFWYVKNVGLVNEYRTAAFRYNFSSFSENKSGFVTYFG